MGLFGFMSRNFENSRENEELPNISWLCEGPSFSSSEIHSLISVILLGSVLPFAAIQGAHAAKELHR